MRRFLPLLLVVAACTPRTPTFDLTPERTESISGTATFKLLTQGLIAIDGHDMSTTVVGNMDVSISPGAFAEDDITVTVTHHLLEMQRNALGQSVVLTTVGEIPETLKDAFAHEDQLRTTTISADRTITLDSDNPVDSDASVLFGPVIWAPEEPVEIGHVWGRELGPPTENGTQWYRSYTLTGVKDGVASIRYVHRKHDPITGDEGPENRRVRGLQKVDLQTGLPYNLRSRSLARGVIGEDTWATFTWPGLQTIEP